MTTKYRLGLDIGTNSIGWAALRLDEHGAPVGIVATGVRVYPDGRNPKDGSSLAVQRRQPRSMRRNRDRYLRRRRALLNALVRFGLMPPDADGQARVAALDPYTLRAEALARRLEPEELGRVLFHLNQHRGFASNRRIDRSDNEGGLIKEASARTRAALAAAGHPTIGSWLAARHANREGVRVRLAGSGNTAEYPFYPTRDMLVEEFEIVWGAQSAWRPELTAAMREKLRHIIFYQRPLKVPPVGRCWLDPSQPRAARALPTAQAFRIAQTLSHLRIVEPGRPDRRLTAEQIGALFEVLRTGKDLPLDRVRKMLALPKETDFTTREEKIAGCATAARLACGKRAAIGVAWNKIDLPTQDKIVSAILDAETEDGAVDILVAAGLPTDIATRAVGAHLPDGHASLCSNAMERILPFLLAGQHYAEAVVSAGFAHHSQQEKPIAQSRLPYYGEVLRARIGTGTGEPDDTEERRLGRAPNPTVHVALNEIRRVVNAIVERHGPPAQIVIETLRELGRSKVQREAYEREQKKNRVANDGRRLKLAELELPVTSRNIFRLRLWEEQAADPKNRFCPYTGTRITDRMALSAEVEEDHILPFALTLDDSAANRILVMREANRRKGRETPFGQYGHTPQWPDILERAQLLPPQKRWRFAPDALAKFGKDGDFLARHLTDSATIARWAQEYLSVLAPGAVWSIPGRLTSLLRHALGITPASVLGQQGTSKDRLDHRHHAMDAVVVALTDRGLLKRAADAARLAAEREERLLADMAEPWPGFLQDVAASVQSITVSYKPDTGWQGALHNDTAYGRIDPARANGHNVVVRRPLASLADEPPENIRDSVADPALAQRIIDAIRTAKDAPGRRAALATLTHSGGYVVRRVRCTETLNTRRAVADKKSGRNYKWLKLDGNHCAEVWRLPDGKTQMVVVPRFDAAQSAVGRGNVSRPHPAARLIMRLYKNDCILLTADEAAIPLRIVKMTPGKLTAASLASAGNLKRRHEDKDDPFRYVELSVSRLVLGKARKVYVAADGTRHWGSCAA